MEETLRLPSFVTVRALMNTVLDEHLALRRHLTDRATSQRAAADSRLPTLCSWLAQRESEQVTALARLVTSEDEALECRLQNVPAAPFDAAFADLLAVGFDQLRDDYARREQAFERMFSLLAASVGPRARTLLSNLAWMKRQSQSRLHEATLDF
jgi:hypothetical protein